MRVVTKATWRCELSSSFLRAKLGGTGYFAETNLFPLM